MALNIRLVEDSDSIDGFETSYCTLNFSGTSVNNVIVNTLRRVLMSLIPSYQFNPENIVIAKNTSIYDNDKMRCRLANFPIYIGKKIFKSMEVINDIDTLEFASELEYKANLGSAEISIVEQKRFEREIDDNLVISINVVNTSDNDLSVMTDNPNVKFYYKKMEIPHIYDVPLLILKLRKDQEFVCNMTADLDIGLFNGIYQPVSNCSIKENGENDYDLYYSSKRQIGERDLLLRACHIIKNKIVLAGRVMAENIRAGGREVIHEGEIDIEGEQHTMGNLLSHYMQMEADFCGYAVGHPNINRCTFKYISKIPIDKVLGNAVKRIVEIFDEVEDKIKDMEFGYKYFN